MIHPRARLFLSIAITVLVYYWFPLPREYWDLQFILAYVAGVSVQLVLIAIMMFRSTAEATMRRSRALEPSNTGVLSAVLLFSSVSLMAIALMLNNSRVRPAIVANLHMGLSLLAIFLSWLFVHTYFALHYARAYYQEPRALDKFSADDAKSKEYIGGLTFPNPGLADYWDFLYYSFTIAMCYQTSDISVTSVLMRRITLIHAIISFIYVSCIFGLVVNLVSNVV
ncbi:DUF1345 domain-containing protein [Pannus brasiliensis CCIBt3594]|uniref:DUF1345 domain-containing protein n=1 Tax=Pannus brasiliensis CCIBt3594 TaxID=1427578 RepID=A0AAW9QXQ4_9CHRO